MNNLELHKDKVTINVHIHNHYYGAVGVVLNVGETIEEMAGDIHLPSKKTYY